MRGVGYEEWRKEGIVVEGWPVQFLPVASPLDAEALARAEVVEFPGPGGAPVPTRVLRPEHIVAIALRVKRPKDYLRVDSFLAVGAVDLAALAATISRHGMRGDWVEFVRKTGRTDPLVGFWPS